MSDSPLPRTLPRTTLRHTLATLAIGLLCCVNSQADTTLSFSGEGDSLPQSIAIGSGKLRVDSAGESQWILYDLQQDAMYMVDDEKKEYYRIDQSQIEQLGQSLGDLSSQLDSALANLPPEQRAAAKAMMQNMLPGKADESTALMIDIRSTGEQDKVADVPCSVHETWVGEQRKNEVCVADSDALELSSKDVETMRGMAKLMQQLLDEVQKNIGDLMPENFAANGLAQLMANGMPVRIRDFDNGNSAQLSAISQDSIAADRLSVPEGYRAQSMDLVQ